MKNVAFLPVVALFLAAAFPPGVAQAQQVSQAQGGYGGPTIERVEVCRVTNSRFFPYVKVSVPEFVADRWIAQERAILPVDGECPPPEQTLRDYIRERVSNIFGRIFR